MDVLLRRGRATAADVLADLPHPPGYSAVRALLRILEEKGHVRHVQAGRRYVFAPVASKATERRSALRHLVDTFFDGSVAAAVQALVDSADGRLSRDQLTAIERKIAAAKREGR